MGPTIIKTERLNLRAWTLADVNPLVKLFAEPEVAQYVNDGKPVTGEQALRFITKYMRIQEERGWCRWALELAEEPGELAGFCGVGCTFAPEIELGWTLRRDLWGQGLATEAAAGALDYCFYTVGFKEIISAIDGENARSIAVAKRLGMTQIGTIDHDGEQLLRYVMFTPNAKPVNTPGCIPNCDGENAGTSL
jgi:RimJ/RimL family protein N-acetyltransferase